MTWLNLKFHFGEQQHKNKNIIICEKRVLFVSEINMSWSWKNHLEKTGGIDRDMEEYIAEENRRNVAEQNRRILILESVGQFDKELCLAVQKRIQQRLVELDNNN